MPGQPHQRGRAPAPYIPKFARMMTKMAAGFLPIVQPALIVSARRSVMASKLPHHLLHNDGETGTDENDPENVYLETQRDKSSNSKQDMQPIPNDALGESNSDG